MFKYMLICWDHKGYACNDINDSIHSLYSFSATEKTSTFSCKMLISQRFKMYCRNVISSGLQIRVLGLKQVEHENRTSSISWP